MKEEIWKDVLGYEGMYQVSNAGQVKSLARFRKNRHSSRLVKERILKPRIGTTGYYYVVLANHRINQSKDIHRLVASCFLGSDNSNLTVNHKDGNKLNNQLNNLEWLSCADNLKHARDVLGRQFMLGRTHSEAAKQKISAAKKAFYSRKR